VAWRHNHKGYFMPFFTKPFMAAALATTLLTAPATFAQDGESADPSQVLATVNGVDITLAHVIAARADLPQQYAQFPAALLFDGLVDQLINQTLLMQSVEGEPSLRARTLIENEERAVIASDAIGALVSGGVDEDELRAAYEEQYPEVEGQQEYRASHILVETEEEAAALIEELEGGADFAALARENSTGPSASVGGDLGWFGEGDMVDPFFQAVVALEPGGVSAPVQTDFGWHIITLAETRDKARPEFETVRASLVEELRQAVLEDHLETLADGAEIERAELGDFDPELITNFELLDN
jgi:peptidyl-prolyl cis-trans isomerase C